MRKVIINADDFGLCSSVNAAIVACYQAGNLTSTTCMVNMPGTVEAAQLAAANPGLAIGLHFCLTEGKPLTSSPSLTAANGEFYDRGTLMRRIVRGQVKTQEIAAEFAAQLAKLRSLGIAPTHTDSHQHTHMNPFVFRAILPHIRQQKLPVRLATPPQLSTSLLFTRPARYAKQWVLQQMSNLFRKQLSVATNDCLVSVHQLPAAVVPTADTFRQLVATAPDDCVVELMVHPYIMGPDVAALYPHDAASREPFFAKCVQEFEVLRQAPVFKDDAQVQLTTFQSY